MKFSSIFVIAGLSFFCGLVSAQPAPGQPTQGPGNQEPHRPPAEALAACKSLSSGAACNFTSPRGAESGTCFAPEGKPLACRPQRGAVGGNPLPKEKLKN